MSQEKLAEKVEVSRQTISNWENKIIFNIGKKKFEADIYYQYYLINGVIFKMNKIVEELKNVGTFYIATVENDQTRVRPFSSVTEYEGNVYLCSGNQKEVYKQIMFNPKIELCGMSKNGEWIRVSAVAVVDDRIEAQEAMLKDPTGLSQLYTAGDGKFVVFKLENVKCMKYNFYSAPQEIKYKVVLWKS